MLPVGKKNWRPQATEPPESLGSGGFVILWASTIGAILARSTPYALGNVFWGKISAIYTYPVG